MEELDDRVESLLTEIKQVRSSINQMITELETLSTSIHEMFPKEISYKSRWVFEQKVKATTEMFKALLDMRKEVMKSLKDEIEIRRKVSGGNSFDDIEELFDVRKLAKRVSGFQKDLDSKKRTEIPLAVSEQMLIEEKKKAFNIHSVNKEDVKGMKGEEEKTKTIQKKVEVEQSIEEK